MRSGVDQRRQQDVPQTVGAQSVQIGVGEIELEPASKVLDPLLQVVFSQCGNGRCRLLKLARCVHSYDLRQGGSLADFSAKRRIASEVSGSTTAGFRGNSCGAAQSPKLAYYWPGNFLFGPQTSDNLNS